MIGEYREMVAGLLGTLSKDKLEMAVAIATFPEEVRGYGHVKERHLKAARETCAALLSKWNAPQQQAKAA